MLLKDTVNRRPQGHVCSLIRSPETNDTVSVCTHKHTRTHTRAHSKHTHSLSSVYFAHTIPASFAVICHQLPATAIKLEQAGRAFEHKKNPNTCFHYEFRMTLRLFGTGYYWHNCCLMGVPMEIAACELIVLIAESNVKDRLNVPQTVFISAERFQMLAR